MLAIKEGREVLRMLSFKCGLGIRGEPNLNAFRMKL